MTAADRGLDKFGKLSQLSWAWFHHMEWRDVLLLVLSNRRSGVVVPTVALMFPEALEMGLGSASVRHR